MTLAERIESRTARVVVVGAGHVGLPLAIETARAGFTTVAYDRSAERVSALTRGRSYILDVSSEALAPLLAAGTLQATMDPDVLEPADIVIICVPTPLNKTRDPDNTAILDAAATIASRLRRPQLIILESTTFPGFTREVLLPLLAKDGRRADEDFFLAFSP
jgi:UDP-N-acetyl-D-glucosamine dehydrogenase